MVDIPKKAPAVIRKIRETEHLRPRLTERERAECDFTDWVAAMGGPTDTARALKISRTTVYNWIDHKQVPTAAMIDKIVAKSFGTLTVETVVLATKAALENRTGKRGRPTKAEVAKRKREERKREREEAEMSDLRAHEVKP